MYLLLEGAQNARDLGGLVCKDGRKIKEKRIVRSSNLSKITDTCRDFLKNYGVKKVIDFRTEAEINDYPDIEIDGAEYIKNPILRDLTAGITGNEESSYEAKKKAVSPEESIIELAIYMGKGAREWMIDLYPPLITDKFSTDGYKNFLSILKNNREGAVLYHCTAGKDRVGVGTALFLTMLGANREDIINDYLLSNESYKEVNDRAIELAIKRGLDSDIYETIPYINGVDISYIEQIFRIIDTEYSNTEEFFYKTFGFDRLFTEEMKNNYLE